MPVTEKSKSDSFFKSHPLLKRWGGRGAVGVIVVSSLIFMGAGTGFRLKPLPEGAFLPADRFIQLAKLINPAVVSITTQKNLPSGYRCEGWHPFFGYYSGPCPGGGLPPQKSLGTGFVIRKEGVIVTNAHVVDGADTIEVYFKNSDKPLKATVLGQDNITDVALLKISSPPRLLPVARLGNSSELQVGEWVAAFGNPYGQSHTMTKGIISAVGREVNELSLFPFLQTDAIIHKGNSGGPLVNMQGRVIGINTAKHEADGISFAIPIDNVKEVLKDLEEHRRVRRGMIGVSIHSKNPTKTPGAFIAEVWPHSPAGKAGIRKHDIVTQFNGKTIKNHRHLIAAVKSTPINTKVPVVVVRNNKSLTLQVSVQENSPNQWSSTFESSKNRPPKPSAFNWGMELSAGTREAFQTLGLPPFPGKHPRPVITGLVPRSPADQAGFQIKDIILKVNGKKVYSPEDATKRLARNRDHSVSILRYHSQRYISMQLYLKKQP